MKKLPDGFTPQNVREKGMFMTKYGVVSPRELLMNHIIKFLVMPLPYLDPEISIRLEDDEVEKIIQELKELGWKVKVDKKERFVDIKG